MLPKLREPAFRKETALVIAVPVAFRPKLEALAAVVKVGVMSAPLKAIVPVVLVSTTLVTVVTAPVKVAPPELVMVRVPMFVPIMPVTLIAPAVPFTLLNKLIAPLVVLVSVVVAPKVTAPV